jgi:hypothetical protein
LSFEAADRFAAALAFVLFAFEVGTGGCVYAALGDRDPVQRAVELAVAAAVEAVSLLFAGAGVERGNSGVACDLGVAGEAVDRSDLAEQLRRAQGAAAGERDQPWRKRLRTLVEFAVEFSDRAGECTAAAQQVARDLDLGRLLAASQPPPESVEPDAAVERAERHLQRRVELVQVPAQPLLAAPTLSDLVVAVIDEQLQLAQQRLLRTRRVKAGLA